MMNLAAITAGVLGASALGAMLFFAGVVAPLVFTRLPQEVAGPFIRQVFPVYYAVLGGCTGLAAAAALLGSDPAAGLVLGAIALAFAYAGLRLMPRINALRDRELAGDASAALPFARAHRASVVLNTVQLLALLGVVVRFVA